VGVEFQVDQRAMPRQRADRALQNFQFRAFDVDLDEI
jgi:hypothetical protein